MLNSSHIQRKLERGPSSSDLDPAASRGQMLEELYLTILSRFPTPEEVDNADHGSWDGGNCQAPPVSKFGKADGKAAKVGCQPIQAINGAKIGSTSPGPWSTAPNFCIDIEASLSATGSADQHHTRYQLIYHRRVISVRDQFRICNTRGSDHEPSIETRSRSASLGVRPCSGLSRRGGTAGGRGPRDPGPGRRQPGQAGQGQGQVGDPGLPVGRHVAQRHLGPQAGLGLRIQGGILQDAGQLTPTASRSAGCSRSWPSRPTSSRSSAA